MVPDVDTRKIPFSVFSFLQTPSELPKAGTTSTSFNRHLLFGRNVSCWRSLCELLMWNSETFMVMTDNGNPSIFPTNIHTCLSHVLPQNTFSPKNQNRCLYLPRLVLMLRYKPMTSILTCLSLCRIIIWGSGLDYQKATLIRSVHTVNH